MTDRPAPAVSKEGGVVPAKQLTGRTRYGEATFTRDDIMCPKSGAPIELASWSISKFSDRTYFVYCADCGVFHRFSRSAP